MILRKFIIEFILINFFSQYFINCTVNSTQQSVKFKFLFADSVFKFNLNNLIFNSSTKTKTTTILPPGMLPGSFICYILIKNDMKITMNGIDEEFFNLENEHFGSTALSVNKFKQKSFLKLYSLKLAKSLNNGYTYELKFNLIDQKNSYTFTKNLTIKISSSKASSELFHSK